MSPLNLTHLWVKQSAPAESWECLPHTRINGVILTPLRADGELLVTAVVNVTQSLDLTQATSLTSCALLLPLGKQKQSPILKPWCSILAESSAVSLL